MDRESDAEPVQNVSSKKSPRGECLVCGAPAHGFHYGATGKTCRACAVFFRRALESRNEDLYKYCRTRDACRFRKAGEFLCRACRLEKCLAAGMNSDNFQQSHDLPSSTTRLPTPESAQPTNKTQKYSFESLKAAVLKIFSEPDQSFEIPNVSSLKSMELGLSDIREHQKMTDHEVVSVMSLEELTSARAGLIKNAAKWNMCCAEFRRLTVNEKIMILRATWHVWARLERLTITVQLLGQRTVTDRIVFTSDTDLIRLADVINNNLAHLDREKLRAVNKVLHPLYDTIFDSLAKRLVDLEPTLMEVAYMLCHLVWVVSGRTLTGDSLASMEKFIDTIDTDIHNVYSNEFRLNNYAVRILRMISIVTIIRKTYLDIHQVMRRAEGDLRSGFGNADFS